MHLATNTPLNTALQQQPQRGQEKQSNLCSFGAINHPRLFSFPLVQITEKERITINFPSVFRCILNRDGNNRNSTQCGHVLLAYLTSLYAQNHGWHRRANGPGNSNHWTVLMYNVMVCVCVWIARSCGCFVSRVIKCESKATNCMFFRGGKLVPLLDTDRLH